MTLENCPFCGSDKIYIGDYEETVEENSYTDYAGEEISCQGPDCGATIREPCYNDWAWHDRSYILEVREELRKRWNRRTIF